ncbi:hypothetical protein PM082_007130 [Marasmius tenuissimus]|nr:hypothetical protein PM082_007130 [Marasmius tenuissimus]
MCNFNFPGVTSHGERGLGKTIAAYGGWNVSVDRMVSVVGSRDPWREATLGAKSLNRTSTERMSIIVAAGGTHCADMIMEYGILDPTIGVAISEALGYMQKWMEEWKADPGPIIVKPASAKSGNGYESDLRKLEGWQHQVHLKTDRLPYSAT